MLPGTLRKKVTEVRRVAMASVPEFQWGKQESASCPAVVVLNSCREEVHKVISTTLKAELK